MHNYCTLFNSNYLTRGLAMYESLKTHSGSFHLFIFAFDDRSFNLLNKLQLDFVTVISLQEFEDNQLLAVKDSRSAGEYCWTCTPSIIKYSIEHYTLDSCTYLDADLYFFGDPAILLNEIGDKSILITEHRYTPKYDQSSTSGIYCVQFMTFKNTKQGIEALTWWRNACLDWCYSRVEDGKFGDQKYLDDWTTRFEGVHVLQHLGGGVAPWNIQQYDLEKKEFQIIFYHFQNFRFLDNNQLELSIYPLKKNVLRSIYKPYLLHLERLKQTLLQYDSYDYHGTAKLPTDWKNFFRNIKRILQNRYNIYTKTYIEEL
ncbi:hypothetical protein [Sulfuricurvum sp.]|uniref:hypothetical protein n=1 Tax=Sulfuricurvum sp. TaxID=2025608 RepID=UPI00262B58B5|nr:hypothetical protein [Sulfuricurvum sp.]MDD3597484.1 hypothetical protein [Sulfuricurvum sp.]